jgi:carboxymethylenebutenolidase
MGREIELTAADGGVLAGYLALPESTPAPGLILLPEVYNTNDHIRAVVDGYAQAGFVVIAPDVYWRQEAGQYLSYTDEGRDKAQALRAELDTDQFTADLGDIAATLRARDDCTGKIGIMGFCLGGKFTYLSCTRLAFDAGVSYYGVQIDEHLDEAADLKCPILMHFASDDPHVTPQTVAAIRARMGEWDNVDIQVHPGTEHGFNRLGYPCYNEAAAATASERTLAHFRRLLA